MRTLLIPPFFMAIYAVALLSITWLITPGIQLASYSVAGCFLAGRMDLPPALRRVQTTGWSSDYSDEESF